MERDEIIAGLKAGRVLIVDGWARPEERDIVGELDDEGLITKEFVTGDQYSYWRITWKKPKIKREINYKEADGREWKEK